MYSLDRLGRSLVHMVTTIDELMRRGVALRSLTDIIDTTTPAGRFELNVFVAMAEYQRALTVERVPDGLEAARAREVQQGGTSPIPLSRSVPFTACTGLGCPTASSTAASACPRARCPPRCVEAFCLWCM